MIVVLGIICLVCLCKGWLITCVAMGVPYWELEDPEDTVNYEIRRYSGLWMNCVLTSRTSECFMFKTFNLPEMIQGARGLSITSLILGFLGIFLIGISIKKNRFGLSFSQEKKIRLIAGVVSIIAGLCMIAGAAWYVLVIIDEHRKQTVALMAVRGTVIRSVPGRAPFVAAGGGGLQILGGIVALSYGFLTKQAEDRRPYICMSLGKEI